MEIARRPASGRALRRPVRFTLCHADPAGSFCSKTGPRPCYSLGEDADRATLVSIRSMGTVRTCGDGRPGVGDFARRDARARDFPADCLQRGKAGSSCSARIRRPHAARRCADARARGTRPGPALRLSLMLPGDRWVSLGPQPIYVPGTTSPTTFSGRVTAVAPHPTNPATLYVGTDSGGIWRTTDNGATWASLTDAVPVPAIQSLTLDPVNPQLVYATTIRRTYGTRWLESTDGGASWDVSRIYRPRRDAVAGVVLRQRAQGLHPAVVGAHHHRSAARGIAEHEHDLLRRRESPAPVGRQRRTFRSVLSLPVDLDFAGPDAATRNPEAPYLRDAAVDPVRPTRLFGVVARPRCHNQACATMNATSRFIDRRTAAGTGISRTWRRSTRIRWRTRATRIRARCTCPGRASRWRLPIRT